jgi:hypothetical protein
MTNLVLLQGERKKREKKTNKQLIAGLQELLAKAETGELKALCYGGIDEDGQTVSLGVLHDEKTGLHEMIGLSQMLSDALLQSYRE